MKQTKNKKRDVISKIIVSFIGSVLVSFLLLLLYASLVKSRDITGHSLLIFLMTAILPGAAVFTVIMQRTLKLKGIVCGAVCGGTLSLIYAVFILSLNSFKTEPFVYLTIPITVIMSMVCGIFASNIRRR